MNQNELLALLVSAVSLLRAANKLDLDVSVEVANKLRDKLPAPIRGNYPLSDMEVSLGLHHGKIDAVKAYRNRTGYSLMDSKKTVEQVFERNGFAFK